MLKEKQDLASERNQKEACNMKYANYYKGFADLLDYPNSQTVDDAIKLISKLESDLPEAAAELGYYLDFVKDVDLDRIEEVYTKTFHIQAICYLDLGYVMFGEDYKRGEFLVNMKKEQREANNDTGENLADFLPNVLTLVPKLENDEFRNELAGRVLLPSIQKMLDEFRSARMIAREKMLKKKHNAILMEGEQNGNIYKHVLNALQVLVKADFGELTYASVEADPKEALQSFLTGCGTCSIPKPQSLMTKK